MSISSMAPPAVSLLPKGDSNVEHKSDDYEVQALLNAAQKGLQILLGKAKEGLTEGELSRLAEEVQRQARELYDMRKTTLHDLRLMIEGIETHFFIDNNGDRQKDRIV